MHGSAQDVDDRTPLLGPSGTGGFNEKPPHKSDQPMPDSYIDGNTFHIPSWTWYKTDQYGKRLPQSIAHRGYKAKFPENTMTSLRGAVEIGADALETDIHLTKDDVVVLSHDPDLKRCFGQKEKIIDCDWNHISQLRTLKEPHVPMPRLDELLQYLAQPGLERIWVLLDIKLDNDAEKVMRLIAKTIESVPPSSRPWNDRIVLGIWAATFLPLCKKYSPGFPVSNIAFDPCYARQFLQVPGVSFNMLQRALMNPIGHRFIRDVKAAQRPLFLWTVNEVNLMKWSIQKEADGVITDDPRLFNEVCDTWDENSRVPWPPLRQFLYTLWLWILITVFGRRFRKKFPEKVGQYIRVKDIKAKATVHLRA